MARFRYLALNCEGRVIGADHHSAKLSEADVALILGLRDEGLSYAAIAAKFDDEVTVTKQTVMLICQGRRRAQLVMGHKRVAVPEFGQPFDPAQADEGDIDGGF